jgi:glycosyltransferase involved in cell wall biosynthesis
MKIALVSEHASPLAVLGGVDAGGQNVHVAALAHALAGAGNSVTVYTRRDCRDLPRRVVMARGVTVEHVDAGPPCNLGKDDLLPFMDAFAVRLARVWRTDPPDVVHSHFWMSGMAAVQAARPLGIPVVHTYHALGSEKRRHQGSADTSPSERLAVEAALARDADRIIATASAEVFELLRMGAPARALKIVPCGVDLERFSPRGPVEPRRRDRFRVVTLSRLVARKGVADVIEAVAGVPEAELIVAGGGDHADRAADREAERLASLACAAGVADRVAFRGRVARADVPPLLRSADVVTCTPWYEPFGIVPLEAMACGTPVVVSAVGGLIDTVIDGVNGLHVPPREPERLAAALAALARDPDRRHALARAGLTRVRARYSWTRIAAETLDVYRAVSRLGTARDALGGSVS